jgi:hypothetical protein
MPAHRPALLAALLLLGATCLRAAPVAADPHELYTRASNDMKRGDLPGADAALARLHAVIKSSPGWDPEGVFSRELIPPLEARLKRLRGVAGKLDAFSSMALGQLRPPDPLKDTSTVRHYTDWATSVVKRLRAERDQIIEADLANPEERAILSRTASYARTQQLLETDALKQMADAAGDDILGLLAGDPNQESIMLRFRQLKLELMQAVADRDRLNGEVERYQQALAAAGMTLGARGTIEPLPKAAGAAPAGDAAAAGDAAEAGDAAAAGDAAPAGPPGHGWKFALFAGALLLAAALLGWLAYARRLRLEMLRRSFDDTRPGLVAGAHTSDADRDAA